MSKQHRSKKQSSKKQKARQKQAQSGTRLWMIAVVAAVVVVVVGLLVARQPTVPTAAAAPAPEAAPLPLEVSVDEAASLRDAGAFMLDVREPEEWMAGHIPGATLIPLGELAARVDEVPAGQQVVVVCRSGNRSQVGRDILLDAGLEQVTSMAGGMNQWAGAGYPVVTGP